jgi:molecular chaperone DnaK
MGRVVGIDLGTTNSAVAFVEGGAPSVVPLAEGARLCPSVIGFSRTGERLVGELAKRQAITHPERTVASVKRRMGSDFAAVIDDAVYAAPQLSAMILQKLKADAEAYLGEPVTAAVITVPAYFDDAQRQATRDAGQIAGLDVLRIVNEPTAAALAYGIGGADSDAHTVLVWDLGGGTFDVSILEIDHGVFEVKSTCGDTTLGGDDWDDILVRWLADACLQEVGIDPSVDRIAHQRLKDAAEKAKIELSSLLETQIQLPFLLSTADGPVHLERTLTRAHLEAQTAALRARMLAPTRQALTDARLSPEQIDRILLVGGSTRMPAVRAMVRDLFGKEPQAGINPDEVVALGAAVQASVLAGEIGGLVLLDVTPLSLGIEIRGGITSRLIPRNTTIPASKSEVFTTAVENQAAVEVHIVQGEREMAADNRSLGRFRLSGIGPAARGVPKIEVTFAIDANGLVSVSARDRATGAVQGITLLASSGIRREEIDRMVRDAAQHADADRAYRALQEARNTAGMVLHTAQLAAERGGGRIEPELLQTLHEEAEGLRERIERAAAPDELIGPTDALRRTVMTVGALLYASLREAQ